MMMMMMDLDGGDGDGDDVGLVVVVMLIMMNWDDRCHGWGYRWCDGLCSGKGGLGRPRGGGVEP